MIVVKTNQLSTASIKVTNQSGTLVPAATGGVTIISAGSLAGAGAGATRLDQLADVVEGTNPQTNSTLVYNAATDKYEVQPLSLDGGAF